ncbi:phosphotransferase [Rhodopseudomonas sp. P2A-2r]|uniref:phosphotransferase n=1 Tax=unclassified Rhodopseudomonas TaxID=2638247 RepID=UPI002234D53D|nr:phosphotransferase [Rhodopseudomonas sp. P2A-2r]UZE49086.1 phosphotransferase [Rhodopseudomonas sp. P2A-2r]
MALVTPLDISKAGDALSAHWDLLPLQQVEELVARAYGIRGVVARLSSERDETFKLTSTDGPDYILKIANPFEDPAALSFQDGALRHLETVGSRVPVPRLIATKDGERSYVYLVPGGQTRIVRLLSYLAGDQLSRLPPSPIRNRNLGSVLARFGKDLENFDGRPPSEKLLWDISHTLDLAGLIIHVGKDRQGLVMDVLAEFERTVPQASSQLRHQIIHNDFNLHNILVDPASPLEIAGVIDFGDMVFAPRINDLAVALAYHVGEEDWQVLMGAMLAGYCAENRLEDSEIAILPVLIKARLAIAIIIPEYRAASRPGNRDYIMRNHGAALLGLQRLSGMSESEFLRFVSANCKE